MLVMGGGRVAPNPSNQVDVYDPGTDSWTTGTPVPAFITARRNFPTDTDGTSRIWLAGGYAALPRQQPRWKSSAKAGGNAGANTNGYCNRDCYCDGNRHFNFDTDGNGDRYIVSNADGHRHGISNRDGHGHRISNGHATTRSSSYANTAPSADASASPIEAFPASLPATPKLAKAGAKRSLGRL